MTTQKSPPKVEQILTFQLADEAYGLEILKVQEIRGWESVRVLPNTPGFIKGALNLRGVIVPIIDLRERFGLQTVQYTPNTVVIVLYVTDGNHVRVMGIVADSVSDVLDIKQNDIKVPPKLGANIDTRYMRGIYMHKNSMVMLLNVDKLLKLNEFEELDSIAGEI
ncbi:MAG: chemotaxis protein CheW [Methylobacter sp.]|nr:MAG: chemotaxis protein CheW [Methylobacter sp.]PPD24179.1 MAG: chemotaxis protein CheW [Methylobacter sp.]PPD37507.1 MAG: chemotaxis protein CheW [Methylomonas sp.]